MKLESAAFCRRDVFISTSSFSKARLHKVRTTRCAPLVSKLPTHFLPNGYLCVMGRRTLCRVGGMRSFATFFLSLLLSRSTSPAHLRYICLYMQTLSCNLSDCRPDHVSTRKVCDEINTTSMHSRCAAHSLTPSDCSQP